MLSSKILFWYFSHRILNLIQSKPKNNNELGRVTFVFSIRSKLLLVPLEKIIKKGLEAFLISSNPFN